VAPKTKANKSDSEGPGELSFEEALEELEDLIDRMEAGETGLEDSIRSYERGAKLVKRCRELLVAAFRADRPDYDQLAERLGMPRGSIGPTRGRCLNKLRTLIEENAGARG